MDSIYGGGQIKRDEVGGGESKGGSKPKTAILCSLRFRDSNSALVRRR